jgi:hypothetical protein
MSTELCDVYYSEVIGDPIPEDFHSATKTEELRMLREVSWQEAAAYIDLYSWSRAYWRVEFLPESVKA